MTEIDLGGLYFPPLLVVSIIAMLLCALCIRLLERYGAYSWIWHRHLFNTSLLVLLIILCWYVLDLLV